jgi:penicillin-binding protein 1A
LTCAVWVGFDAKKSIGSRMTGAAAALPAWTAFMKEAVVVYGEEDFVAPEGITQVATCEKTGLLASPGCPKVIQDAFITGTEPTKHCGVHQGLPPAEREITAPEEAPETDEQPGESPGR